MPSSGKVGQIGSKHETVGHIRSENGTVGQIGSKSEIVGQICTSINLYNLELFSGISGVGAATFQLYASCTSSWTEVSSVSPNVLSLAASITLRSDH